MCTYTTQLRVQNAFYIVNNFKLITYKIWSFLHKIIVVD